MLAITDESDLSPTGVVNNGSGTLINTGLGRFLVTNDHVYQAFQNRHDARRVKLLMSAKDAFIDISDQPLVDRDPDFDLAVLRISEDLVDFHGKTYSPWPSCRENRPSLRRCGGPRDRSQGLDLAVLRISEDLVDFHGKTYSPWP